MSFSDVRRESCWKTYIRDAYSVAAPNSPRTSEAFLVDCGVCWSVLEQAKYHVLNYSLQVFVISLERVSERKREIVFSLEEQGIHWMTHNATDGLEDLDMKLVKKYAGLKKRERPRCDR